MSWEKAGGNTAFSFGPKVLLTHWSKMTCRYLASFHDDQRCHCPLPGSVAWEAVARDPLESLGVLAHPLANKLVQGTV